MKLLEIAANLLCVTYALDNHEIQSNRDYDSEFLDNMHFLHYCAREGIEYVIGEEFEYRKSIYLQNDAWINKWNRENADAGFTMGHNLFSVYTDDEFAARFKVNQ